MQKKRSIYAVVCKTSGLIHGARETIGEAYRLLENTPDSQVLLQQISHEDLAHIIVSETKRR